MRPNENTDIVVTRKLSDKDLVNLALGRPLGSKVDGKTEILAWAGTFEPLSSPSRTRGSASSTRRRTASRR